MANVRHISDFDVPHWGKQLLVATIIGMVLTPSGRAQAPTVETTLGTLPDGTAFRIDVPSHWNGTLLLGLDYASRDPLAPTDPTGTSRLLLSKGYAMAGTTRLVTGWAIHLAAANAVLTLDRFEAKYGKPKHAVEFGSSMGGHTAAISAQAYPARWDAALPACGGLAGSVAQWQGKMDALFVAKTLLARESDLPVIHIPPNWQKTSLPGWQAVFAEAQKTPAGRARIALAAAFGQLPDWSSEPGQRDAPPKPQPDNLTGRQAGWTGSLVHGLLPQALSSRAQIERLGGGNISSNVGVDYAAVLHALDPKGDLETIYAQAGISLPEDLKKLAAAPRFAADPDAIAYMATGTFDGELKMPVLTLNGLGDPISVVPAQQAYGEAVHRAGKDALLRQVYVASAGHCNFTAGETLAAVETLEQRLDTGSWPATDAAVMNTRAEAMQPSSGARFVAFTPPAFQRAFSACDFYRVTKGTEKAPVKVDGQQLPVCKIEEHKPAT
jgi:hypothetical protein